MTDAEAVNVYAAGDPEGRIVVALRVDGDWHDYRVQRRDAELFGDVIYLLTRPENVEEPK